MATITEHIMCEHKTEDHWGDGAHTLMIGQSMQLLLCNQCLLALEMQLLRRLIGEFVSAPLQRGASWRPINKS